MAPKPFHIQLLPNEPVYTVEKFSKRNEKLYAKMTRNFLSSVKVVLKNRKQGRQIRHTLMRAFLRFQESVE